MSVKENPTGRIPSTAEPGADRASAFATVATMPARLPPGWRLRLLPDHRIRVETVAEPPPAPTAISLIAAMVRFALALDPYLDRLESASVGSSGTLTLGPDGFFDGGRFDPDDVDAYIASQSAGRMSGA